MLKPKCFVIQKFDNHGFFDDLFDLVIEPAVDKAGFDCRRADKILGANRPLNKIESEINGSSICIAEITTDNPNVFLELGWAIGLKKPFFILWDKSQRADKLPFDVSHEAGIPYDSSETGWQKKLKDKVIENLKHELQNLSDRAHTKANTPANEEPESIDETELAILGALLKAEANHQEICVTALSGIVSNKNNDPARITLSIKNYCAKNLYKEITVCLVMNTATTTYSARDIYSLRKTMKKLNH